MDFFNTQSCEMYYAFDIIFRNENSPCILNCFCKQLIRFLIERIIFRVRLMACFNNIVQMYVQQARTRNKRSNFLLFDDFPLNKLFYIGMVEVKRNHFGRASCCTAGFNSSCAPIANLEK